MIQAKVIKDLFGGLETGTQALLLMCNTLVKVPA
jgi:hypothetical protein